MFVMSAENTLTEGKPFWRSLAVSLLHIPVEIVACFDIVVVVCCGYMFSYWMGAGAGNSDNPDNIVSVTIVPICACANG